MAPAKALALCSDWTRERFRLPPSPYPDDYVAQWGSFGVRPKVLLLVFNPGGRSSGKRNAVDAELLPAWEAFRACGRREVFEAAQLLHLKHLSRTSYWRDHVRPVLEALRVEPRTVALCNCLPYRTPDLRWSAETRLAAAEHVRELVGLLRPRHVVAMGCFAASIARASGRPADATWTRGWRTPRNDWQRARTARVLRTLQRR